MAELLCYRRTGNFMLSKLIYFYGLKIFWRQEDGFVNKGPCNFDYYR